MNKEEIKSKYFSCVYCLTPQIIYNPSNDPLVLITKCFENHENVYNINDYLNFRKKQFELIENITCDKCKSRKNLSFYKEDKFILCQKCFPKFNKGKNPTIFNLNKIDKCPKHNKDYFYCTQCNIIYCQKCSKDKHTSHNFTLIKDYFLSEKEKIKLGFIVNKLKQINFDLNYRIFKYTSNNYDFSGIIYQHRLPEISLYELLNNEYTRRYSKYGSYNVLFNIRNLILNKYNNIENLSYTDFINETKINDNDIYHKELMIDYLSKNYINFDHSSYNNEQNISILEDKNAKNLNIKYFLLLNNNNIFIASNITCFLYNKSMELKALIKLKDIDEEKITDRYQIISYIHYKKYNKENLEKNTEIIYAFITSTIYEISIIQRENNNFILEKKEYNCKRISFKIDGVIDMFNGDLITCCHMYPVICWRKDKLGNFYEYKDLTEEKPYIKNAINIIHLPDNEFAFTSHSWPSLKFYKYDNDYILIKDIRMNCSPKKNTMTLFKNKILIVGIGNNGLYLLDVKNKEIILKIEDINIDYMFIRQNGEIIIRENLNNSVFIPLINIYKFVRGELLYKGVLKNKLQISVKQIYEAKNGELFIAGYDNFYNIEENYISRIYVFHN